MTITDSPPIPPTATSPPTTSTVTNEPTTTSQSTTTTTTQFDQHIDVHSSLGREGVDPYIAGLPVYDERPENDLVFGVLTSVGYFFITIVLMIGVIMGDDQRYTVRKFSLEMI